jgi:hypothetical protein
MKHIFKKKPGASKNRPEDSEAATPPSKKKKKIKDEETDVAAPDVIPSIPVFITPPPNCEAPHVVGGCQFHGPD